MRIIPFRTSRKMKPSPSEIPLYGVAEVARWVGVPVSTLRKWVYGRDYPAAGGTKRSLPLIIPADADKGLLSFSNIAEAHLLDVTRKFSIPRADVRAAIDLVIEDDPSSNHPLLTGKFYRFGKRLFVEYLGEKVSASKPTQGQRLLSRELDFALERIERDDRGRVFRLFPMRRNENRKVMMDFNIAGGQPVVAGTGILVEFLHERYKAGESTKTIAADTGLSRRTVDEAIKYVAA